MRKNDAYPSKYFKAANYPDDWTLTVEVEMTRLEEFEGGDRGKGSAKKLVVYFRKQQSGLVAGPVIWDQFIEATGEDDCDDWKGHRVELYRDYTPFAGKNVPCIRVRKPEMAPPKKKTAKKPASKSGDDEKPDYDDSVEF